MTSPSDDRTDQSALNAAARQVWETNAAFWDEQMADGNQFQQVLVGPALERLLEIQPGERVLEIACGNGVFARRMAALGAHVVATDFSANMIERARARGSDHIDYRVVDATDGEQLLALGAGTFDAAVCSMAFMDMADLDPMLQAVRQLLKPNGRFAFATMHPSFNSGPIRRVVLEEDRDGTITVEYAIQVSRYVQSSVQRGIGIIGQPEPHYYFHRSLSTILQSCFAAGFVLDGLEEPAFTEQQEGLRPLSWQNFTGIPPVLAGRLRPEHSA